MIRTARLIVAAAGLLAAMVLPSTLASAAPADPTTPAPSAPSTDSQTADVDWGYNKDGWEVTVINHSNHDLTYTDHGPASYVQFAYPRIPAGKIGYVKGKESLLHKGEPANMDFEYKDGPKNPMTDYGVVLVRANGNGNMDSTHCVPAGVLKCTIRPTPANQPIEVEYTDA